MCFKTRSQQVVGVGTKNRSRRGVQSGGPSAEGAVGRNAYNSNISLAFTNVNRSGYRRTVRLSKGRSDSQRRRDVRYGRLRGSRNRWSSKTGVTDQKRLKSVPSSRFELLACGLGRRDRPQKLQNQYCFEGFLCGFLGQC